MEKTNEISRKRLLKELSNQHFEARTFDSRIKIRYKDSNQSINGSGHIKILKDSIVWISVNFLGFPIAKMYITPHKIQYYNKINSEYYDGSFDFINQKLGTALNFDNLQNLLMGDAISDDLSAYKLSINKDYYELKAQKNQPVKVLKIYSFFKILSELIESRKGEKLEISYFDYQRIEREQLPKKLKVKTRNTSKNMEIEMEYKNPTLDKELRFPFQIPSGYREIRL